MSDDAATGSEAAGDAPTDEPEGEIGSGEPDATADATGDSAGDAPTGEPNGDAPTGGSGTAGVACPFCGSTDTREEQRRGPALCRTVHFCGDCQQPFEEFG